MQILKLSLKFKKIVLRKISYLHLIGSLHLNKDVKFEQKILSFRGHSLLGEKKLQITKPEIPSIKRKNGDHF